MAHFAASTQLYTFLIPVYILLNSGDLFLNLDIFVLFPSLLNRRQSCFVSLIVFLAELFCTHTNKVALIFVTYLPESQI